MQDLLKTQRVGNRRPEVKPRSARRHGRSRRPGRFSLRRIALFSIIARIFRIVWERNRYVLVTAVSLVALLATGLLFSALLGKTAPPRESRSTASGAGEDVSAQALDTAYQLGAGTHLLVRDRDVEYVLEEGDTLYSLGKLYVIKPQELREFNKINDPNRLRVGSTIVIPSKENLDKFKTTREKLRLAAAERTASLTRSRPASLLPARLSISAATTKKGPVYEAAFRVDGELPDEGISYTWDLGDGSVSRQRRPVYSYLDPGTYNVSLKLKDKHGYELRTNTVTLEVSSTEGVNLIRTMYLTVGAVGEVFTLAGKITQVEDFFGRAEKPVQFVEEREGSFFYRALVPGNFSLIARGQDTVYKVFLFISPFPSVHSDRFDVDWYRTQYNTGSSNCGPASVSMGIGWAKGDFVSVSAVRNYLGFRGDGGTSFPQLEKAFKWKGVKARTVEIAGLNDLYAVIDGGEIAIILFYSGGVSRARGAPELDYIGRYYGDAVGHYVVVKGYTADKKYLVVYDPLPSDWFANAVRYGDGASMLGRNRYYSSAEVERSLSVNKILVVSR